MLYQLLQFALRPFRRWWRRLLTAAIVATVVVPLGRALIDDAVRDQHDTITVPPIPSR